MAIRTITDLPFFEISSNEDIERLKHSVFEVSIISGDYSSHRYVSKAIKGNDLFSVLNQLGKLSGDIFINTDSRQYDNYSLGLKFGVGDIEIKNTLSCKSDQITLNGGYGQIIIKNNQNNKGVVNLKKYATVEECNGEDQTSIVNVKYLQEQIGQIPGITTAIEQTYPVGSIYITVNELLPETFTRTMTWKRVSKGMCLWGYDEGNNTLSTEIPAGLPNITGTVSGLSCSDSGEHTHSIKTSNDGFKAAGGNQSTYRNYRTGTTGSAGTHTHDIDGNLTITGDPIYGTSNTVQPPAFVVSMWQRIS